MFYYHPRQRASERAGEIITKKLHSEIVAADPFFVVVVVVE